MHYKVPRHLENPVLLTSICDFPLRKFDCLTTTSLYQAMGKDKMKKIKPMSQGDAAPCKAVPDGVSTRWLEIRGSVRHRLFLLSVIDY